MSKIVGINELKLLRMYKTANEYYEDGKIDEALVLFSKLMYEKKYSALAVDKVCDCFNFIQPTEFINKYLPQYVLEDLFYYIDQTLLERKKDDVLNEIIKRHELRNNKQKNQSIKGLELSVKVENDCNKETDIDFENVSKEDLSNFHILYELLSAANFNPTKKILDLIKEVLVDKEFNCLQKQAVVEIVKNKNLFENFNYIKASGEEVNLLTKEVVLVRDDEKAKLVKQVLEEHLLSTYIIPSDIIEYFWSIHFCDIFPFEKIDENIHAAYLYYKITKYNGIIESFENIAKKFSIPTDSIISIVDQYVVNT